ncbi:MAG: hypothetical protein IJU49_01660 [Lachnospiraceae bacterium]|nr:hypothetical protein [Lachnospiraceae bacterium]
METQESTSVQKKKKRIRYYEEGKKDIRYRGPLSYRAFKILGWLCIIIAQVVVLMNLDMRLDPYTVEIFDRPATILNSISTLSVPLLLMANFALILNASEGYHRQIIRYFLTFSGVAALSILLYLRYIVGAAEVLLGDRAMAKTLLESMIVELLPTGYWAFNLFVDLFLCAVLMYLLNYRPKHVFTGKKVIVFRMFSLLPIGYELVTLILKIMAIEKKITLPMLLFPFLPVKPPITFIVFLIMAFFIKFRERRFLRHGRSHEEYQAFLKTNRNSLHFSTFSAVLLAVAGTVDVIAAVVMVFYFVIKDPSLMQDFSQTLDKVYMLGFGRSATLLLISPLMLLFSYTRTHKNRLLDSFIPIISIVIIVLVYLEGFFQFFQSIPIMIQNLIGMLR